MVECFVIFVAVAFFSSFRSELISDVVEDIVIIVIIIIMIMIMIMIIIFVIIDFSWWCQYLFTLPLLKLYQVRDSAISALVEIYRHVGEKVRVDLSKKGIPSSRSVLR